MSAGLSIIGGVVGAAGAMKQASAEAQADTYNAMVADRNVKITQDQTLAAERDKRYENRRILHSIRATYGSMGIDEGIGTATDVIYDSTKELSLDVKRIRYAGKIKQYEFMDQATLDRMAADNAIEAGKISAISSILGGLSGAMSSMGGMMGMGG